MADVRAQLVQAYNWIKEGKKGEAEALLIRILGNDERNADAWWLLANALDDPAEQAEALDQLLELRPNDEKAQKMLGRLRLTPTPAPTPPAQPIQAAPAARPSSPPPARPAPTREPDPLETVEDDSDPFADVKSSDDDPFAEVIDSRRRGSAEPDPFDDEEDPFAVAEAAKPKRKTAPPAQTSRWDEKSKREPKNNNLLIILGVIAAIVVIVGGVCVYAVIQFQRGFQQVVTEVMNDPTVQAALNDPTLQAAFADPTFQAAFQTGGSFDGFASERLPSGATSRGPLMPNQTGRAEVDTFVDDSWIFNADAGAAYTVEVIATDSDLDPQLAVYGADSQLVGANDDIDGMDNLNSRLQFTASQNGIYTIIVSAFGQGGGYEVIVRR